MLFQIRMVRILTTSVKSLVQQNMDIYRRSRLSEQELEALELREREVIEGHCATRRSILYLLLAFICST